MLLAENHDRDFAAGKILLVAHILAGCAQNTIAPACSERKETPESEPLSSTAVS